MSQAFHLTALTLNGTLSGIVHDGVFYVDATPESLETLGPIDWNQVQPLLGPRRCIAVPWPFNTLNPAPCTVVDHSLSDLGNLLDARQLA
jgi:hypothetical protein